MRFRFLYGQPSAACGQTANEKGGGAGEASSAGTRLTLFADDNADRFFRVTKFWIDQTLGFSLARKTGVPSYQFEDEEGRIHLLLHLPVEENEDRWCLWRPGSPPGLAAIRVIRLSFDLGVDVLNLEKSLYITITWQVIFRSHASFASRQELAGC